MKIAMASPLDLRIRIREAQRAVRLALNAVNSSLDSWKEAVGEGKRQATDLTNAILTVGHLPALPLGALSDVPHLRDRAAAKLVAQQQRLLGELRASLTKLEAAAGGLGATATAVQQLADKEAAEPVLGGRAVFTALPLPAIASMLEEVAGMYREELHVKRTVVRGFAGVCCDAAQQNPAGGGEAAELQATLEAKLQVHITAWMLDAEVHEGRVEEHLALLTEDSNSV